jgi:hypothetical protein
VFLKDEVDILEHSINCLGVSDTPGIYRYCLFFPLLFYLFIFFLIYFCILNSKSPGRRSKETFSGVCIDPGYIVALGIKVEEIHNVKLRCKSTW